MGKQKVFLYTKNGETNVYGSIAKLLQEQTVKLNSKELKASQLYYQLKKGGKELKDFIGDNCRISEKIINRSKHK